MARTDITAQQIVRTGLEETFIAATADGQMFANDGRMILHVKNGAGAPINVTIQTPGSVDGLAIAEQVVAVTNGEERFIGPFPTNIYNQADEKVYVDYSSPTTVTVAVLRV
jgi:hypothetical protein